MISDDKLKKILEEFDKPREEFEGKSYRERRKEWFDKPMEEIKKYLKKEKLETLTIEEALYLYNKVSVGGPKLYPTTFKQNGIEKIRKSLIYLIYGKDPVEERFYNFAFNIDSEYKLMGVGRNFASILLYLSNPKEYAIWNGAVDGGLEMLGLLPKKERGEHQGRYYLKIIDVVKNLSIKLGLNDLSLTDEFLELIFHKKIGYEIINKNVKDKNGEEHEKDETLHTKIQYQLIKIGKFKNYDVWVARNDLNKEYNGEKFSDLCLNELPKFINPEVLDIAQYVDVIWFKKKSTYPICFFEIETTTSIYSGLLRLNDIKIDFPIEKAYIISSKKRKDLYDTQIRRKTFISSGLDEVCQFKTYEEISDILKKLEELKDIDF
ncbi:MAG: hypothetical protein QXP60_09325 [Nitrososphaerota archaeon]